MVLVLRQCFTGTKLSANRYTMPSRLRSMVSLRIRIQAEGPIIKEWKRAFQEIPFDGE